MNRRDFLKLMSVTTVAACAKNPKGPVSSPSSNEVPVLILAVYARDASPKEVLEKAQQQFGPSRATAQSEALFTLDTSYDPVRMRPPRRDREKYEPKGLAFWVVRGFIDPGRIKE